MPRWLEVIFAVCLIIIAVSLAVLAFSRPDTREPRRHDVPLVKAWNSLLDFEIWADVYYQRHGRYGNVAEVAEEFAEPGETANFDILTLVLFAFPSADGEAYLAITREDVVECAQVEYRGYEPPTAADYERWRLPKVLGWNPEEIAGIQCRRTDWPWSWLRWAGLDRISAEEMERSFDRLKASEGRR